MAINGTKLGELLMDADIITKRQLAKACQKQAQGDKRKIGEILVEMGYVNVADLTEVMMEQANKAQSETEKGKRDRLLQKQIVKSKSKSKKPKPVVEKVVAQPVEISEEKAHLVLKEALRVKVNNEPLEEISSFYIFIKEDNKWKIKFSSAFFFPK